MSNFNNYSKYYDLLYKDKDYLSEVDYVLKTINNYNKNCNQILELGCGSGNHAAYFSKKNISITGIELSQTMVDEAVAKKIPNFSPIQGNITNFVIENKFDAVISLFHVISYLTENEDLINCFKTVHNHLNENGLFVFDFWFTPAVYSQKPETRVRRLENDLIEVVRIAESDSNYEKNVVNVNFDVHIKDKKTLQVQEIKEQHPMRHFSIPELALLATMTGFKIVKTEEFLTQSVPSDKSWGVCVVLQKI